MKHLRNSTTCITCGQNLSRDYAVTDGGMLTETDVPALGIACIGVVLECGWCHTQYIANVSLQRFTAIERSPLNFNQAPQLGVRS